MTTLAETRHEENLAGGGPGQAQGGQMGSAQSVDEDHEARRGKASDLAVSSRSQNGAPKKWLGGGGWWKRGIGHNLACSPLPNAGGSKVGEL